MRKNRFTAALLAFILALNLVVPATAATVSSFTDVNDTNTAVNADVLRLMGVVDGVGGNQFNPNGTLTRGAFCKMLVTYMGENDKLPLYSTRTIFSDVPASHWASSFVNLVASTPSGDEGMLIAGVGDGTFAVNSVITFAQAVTILIRVLGYCDSDTGGIWPNGYLNLAASIGLTEGLNLSHSSHITRSQAAQLFVQALSTKTKSGTPYYETMGGHVEKDVMLLATNVTDTSGRTGTIRTSNGTYPPQNAGVNPVALQGHCGVMVTNDKQEIVTFIPNDSESVRITLSADAQATYLLASGGKKYAVHGETPVFTYGVTNSEGKYSDKWTDLKAGTQVTIFLENGTVTAIYSGESVASTQSVVVTGTPTLSQFYTLTGGNTDFDIYRNGAKIQVSEIKRYDVVTYDATLNALIVSDLRITAVYESGSPNSTTPTTIRILGEDFPVLENALDQSDRISVGQTASFLLTADGSIAAMVKPVSATRSTMYGIAGSNSVEVKLPAGGTITLESNAAISDSLQGSLVTVSSASAGRISATRISSMSSGIFDVKAMTLGGKEIAPNFGLYEQVGGGAVTALPVTALDMDSIPASGISAFRLDASGNVDIIVLNGVTGDGYTYGKLIETPKSGSDDAWDSSNREVTVENGKQGISPAINNLIATTYFPNGAFGGVAMGAQGRASSVIVLDGIKNISRTDFFTAGDKTYVSVGSKSYEVAEYVECYIVDNDSWVSLSELRAYSDNLTVYIDDLGDTVRIITATEK